MTNAECEMLGEFSEMMSESGRSMELYRKHLSLIANLTVQADKRLRAIEAKLGLESPIQVVPKSIAELREELALNAASWTTEQIADQLKKIEVAMGCNPT